VEAVVVAPIVVDVVEKGHNYTGSANASKRGVCTNLGTNVFDYGQKSASYQMCTWVVLTEPVHTNDVLLRHGVREVMIRNGQLNIQRARLA
jgi:hypothetical protein